MINHNNKINKAKNNRTNKIIKNKRLEKSEQKVIIKDKKKIMKYTDEEMNSLSYDLAISLDKRTFCEYYISLIKTKQSFINSFIYDKDYNSKIIKIDLFFLNFSIFYVVNALFFTNDIMHKIYEDKGNFNFIYQL